LGITVQAVSNVMLDRVRSAIADRISQPVDVIWPPAKSVENDKQFTTKPKVTQSQTQSEV
jgi:hypothetical protein